MKEVKYLIVGNGVAGNKSAETIRKKDKSSSILIIGKENKHFYYRPQLADFILDNVDEEKIMARNENFYKEKKIELLLGRKVIEIDGKTKLVILDNGEKIKYKKLLIATGISPYTDNNGFGLKNLNDAKKIKQLLPQINDVLVYGEYIFILELMRALVHANKRITYLCPQERLWKDLFDEKASWYLEQLFISKGINILYQTKIEKIEKEPKGRFLIRTNTNSTINSDMCFIASYYDINEEIFLNAGLEYANPGIYVNKYLETNIKDIYAAGDIAQPKYESPSTFIHLGWQRASIQGEIGGKNMLGESTEFNPLSTSIHVRFDLTDLIIAGEVSSPLEKWGEDIILESVTDNYYKRIHIKDNIVKGLIFTGGLRGLARTKDLLIKQTSLTSAEKHILKKDLVEGYGETISLQVACPICKTILDLPITIEVGEKIECEVCGAELKIARTKVSLTKCLKPV
jgi:NAD(P)H-nitrite reductase large subunit